MGWGQARYLGFIYHATDNILYKNTICATHTYGKTHSFEKVGYNKRQVLIDLLNIPSIPVI